jgi:CRISPR-associated endonuclease/helicase Cas3
MTEYYAHSENGRKEKHTLSKHLFRTAELAESFACKDIYKPIFKMTGLLHDLGKYQPAFQEYLISGGVRGSIPHASWGAGYSRLLKFSEASIAIDGHHKGLPDNAAWKSDTEPFKRGEVPQFENIKQAFINDTGTDEAGLSKLGYSMFTEGGQKFQRELFVRYLFSALTDSDWLSTEEHFDQEKFNIRVGGTLSIDSMIRRLDEEFDRKSKDGEINRLRNYARYQATLKACMPYGFYSLALPTGMGKTLTSMAWALRHAKEHDLKRVIIVLPYINIIDQTAQILKDIFGEELVLEHHSGYNENDTNDCDENCSLIEKRKRLACENWDYPIIVTTTVQFFESLFSNRPSRCRKIHNVAESIVIFDEVQAIPKEVILPTLQMLKDVQTVMKTSFLFCTATQPAFEKRPGFDGISGICPLIDNPDELYERTKRVDYELLHDLQPVDYDELLESVMSMGDSVLVIFNTKKAALEFYRRADRAGGWEKKYHLSTAMCPIHRKAVINKIRDDLEGKEKILLVSTQLIEAGVDFDFPVVFRAVAPLEGVIQSAGRCNREGKLGYLGGKVILFKLLEAGMPNKTYAACAGYAEELIRHDVEQLHGHTIFNEYYEHIIQLYVDPDRFNITVARKGFQFKTVHDAYRIIDTATEGVFVYNYNEESRQMLHDLEFRSFLSRDDYRKMQRFTVQVYDHFIFNNGSMCKLMSQGFRVWYGNYDSKTGISVDPIAADKYVV